MPNLTIPLLAALLTLSVPNAAVAQTRLPPLNQWSPDNLTGGIDMGDSGCGAEQLQSMLGHPAELVEALPGLRVVRVIPPGQPITQDYRQERINFDLDATGFITRVWCG